MFNKLLFRLVLTASLVTFGTVQTTFAADSKTESSINILKSTASTENPKQPATVTNNTNKAVESSKQSMSTIKKTAVTSASSMSKKININTASVDDLMSIKGIGKSKAKAIVDYRKKNGKFTDLTELTNVKGIGDGILTKVTPFLKLK